MKDVGFEWHTAKATNNRKKHGVSFEEASTVFLDENATIYYDPEHSKDEDRYIIHGMSRGLRVLLVCYCYREDEDIIRIISARKADKQEIRYYFRRK